MFFVALHCLSVCDMLFFHMVNHISIGSYLAIVNTPKFHGIDIADRI